MRTSAPSLALRIRLTRRWLVAVVALGLIGLLSLPTAALQYGSGTYGGCQYGSCGISISTTGSVALDVTPTASGSCTTQKDTVSVLTSNTGGFTLTLADTSTNTALLHSADSISSTTGTQANPVALSSNRWGYRVDAVGGFGAGPTSARSSVAMGATAFASVPASNAPASTIASTAGPASPAVSTSVWYGLCVNTTPPSGTYTSQVLYTAVAN